MQLFPYYFVEVRIEHLYLHETKDMLNSHSQVALDPHRLTGHVGSIYFSNLGLSYSLIIHVVMFFLIFFFCLLVSNTWDIFKPQLYAFSLTIAYIFSYMNRTYDLLFLSEVLGTWR